MDRWIGGIPSLNPLPIFKLIPRFFFHSSLGRFVRVNLGEPFRNVTKSVDWWIGGSVDRRNSFVKSFTNFLFNSKVFFSLMLKTLLVKRQDLLPTCSTYDSYPSTIFHLILSFFLTHVDTPISEKARFPSNMFVRLNSFAMSQNRWIGGSVAPTYIQRNSNIRW